MLAEEPIEANTLRCIIRDEDWQELLAVLWLEEEDALVPEHRYNNRLPFPVSAIRFEVDLPPGAKYHIQDLAVDGALFARAIFIKESAVG